MTWERFHLMVSLLALLYLLVTTGKKAAQYAIDHVNGIEKSRYDAHLIIMLAGLAASIFSILISDTFLADFFRPIDEFTVGKMNIAAVLYAVIPMSSAVIHYRSHLRNGVRIKQRVW